jgi:hypothetical protein
MIGGNDSLGIPKKQNIAKEALEDIIEIMKPSP